MRPDRPAATPLPFTIQGAMEQAETGHAAADQVRVARDVTTMFDELKAMANRRSGTGAPADCHTGRQIAKAFD